jgi:regulator of sigma E protease
VGQNIPGPAALAGLKEKDVVTAVDGKAVSSFSDIMNLVALGAGRDEKNHPQVSITYLRDGVEHTTSVLPELVGPEKVREIGIEPGVKVTVSTVSPGSAAEQAGVKSGDVILAFNGEPVGYTAYISDHVRKSNGAPITLKLLRDNHEMELTMRPKLTPDPETKTEAYRLGLMLRGAFTAKTLHIAPWTQIQQHLLFTWRNLVSLVNRHSDVGLSKMHGPLGIARIFHSAAESGMVAVLWFTILININLAVFNLLPVPVLDGGQMVFATIARLRGRALPINFIATTQGVFMVLILLMFAYITKGDVLRWMRDKQNERAEAAAPATPAAAPSNTTK